MKIKSNVVVIFTSLKLSIYSTSNMPFGLLVNFSQSNLNLSKNFVNL